MARLCCITHCKRGNACYDSAIDTCVSFVADHIYDLVLERCRFGVKNGNGV